MTPPDDERLETHWDDVAYHWHAFGSPLRPSPRDIDTMEHSVREWQGRHASRAPRVVMLGVTPEIASMAWPSGTELAAIDRSETMIRRVWPGDVPSQRTAVCVDWFDYDYGRGYNDIVIGDGHFTILRFPDQCRALARRIAASLAPGGLLVTRLFLHPDQRESAAEVLHDLAGDRIGSIHAFKFRLAMALQTSATRGVRMGDVFDAWQASGIDPDALGARRGWPRRVIDTLRCYERKDARLAFPTAAEMRTVMAEFFEAVSEVHGDYEMGERCPVVTYQPR